MADRYFCDAPISPGPVTLDGPEAHHLIHVMRAARGTRVVLFDGKGGEYPAVVERVGRAELTLTALAREETDRELPFDLTLGVALPKGDRQKWLVEKAVELGVTRIVPLRTERGVAQPVEQALTRLRRSVIEASKQCGRNRLMEIAEPEAWDDFLESVAAAPCRLLAHPKGNHINLDIKRHFAECLSEGIPSDVISPTSPECECAGSNEKICANGVQSPTIEAIPERVCLAVGPEGGFSSNEVALAIASGWHTIDLGPRILRVETAALALAALVTQAVSAGPCVRE